MRMHTLSCLSLTLALFACGEEEEKASTVEDPATVQNGKTVGQQSTALANVPAGADESAGQAAFNQVGTSMQAFVNQYEVAKNQESAGQPSSLPGQLRQAQMADDDEFSFTDGNLKANIAYDSPQGAITYVVDLIIGDAEGGKTIDGTFDFSYSGNTGGFNTDISYDAVYDGVKITGTCAAEGSITIDYKFEVSGGNLPPQAAGQANRSGTLKVTFGPTCDDVAVEGT